MILDCGGAYQAVLFCYVNYHRNCSLRALGLKRLVTNKMYWARVLALVHRGGWGTLLQSSTCPSRASRIPSWKGIAVAPPMAGWLLECLYDPGVLGNLGWVEAIFSGVRGREKEGRERRGRELLHINFPGELKQAHYW